MSHNDAPVIVPVQVRTTDATSAGIAIELTLPSGVRLHLPPGFATHEVITLVQGLCEC
jgi:hypothetical protein